MPTAESAGTQTTALSGRSTSLPCQRARTTSTIHGTKTGPSGPRHAQAAHWPQASSTSPYRTRIQTRLSGVSSLSAGDTGSGSVIGCPLRLQGRLPPASRLVERRRCPKPGRARRRGRPSPQPPKPRRARRGRPSPQPPGPMPLGRRATHCSRRALEAAPSGGGEAVIGRLARGTARHWARRADGDVELMPCEQLMASPLVHVNNCGNING